ncbi:MAG: TldD/PmbA family protein [archaeon]|nr:TldD/PmbA family protein [archaeon]
MNEIMEKASNIIRKHKDYELEFFGSKCNSLICNMRLGKVHSVNSSVSGGIGVKAIVKGLAGFSYTTDLSHVEKTIRQAIANSKNSQLKQKTFPTATKSQPVKGIYDKETAELSSDSVMRISVQLLDKFKSIDSKLEVSEAVFDVSLSDYFLVNTNELQGCARLTDCSAFCSTIYKGSNGDAMAESNSVKMLNMDKIVQRASNFAINGLGAKPVSSKIQTVVLDADVLESLFGHTLYPSLNADRVRKGQSVLEDKLGTKIASSCLTVFDDGRLEYGLVSSPFDRDGVSALRTEIISGGVLKNFMYNYSTAEQESTVSTGNGAGGFNKISSISPTNFVVARGDSSFDNIISEIKDGIIIYEVLGAHTSNPITGDFSLAVAKGFKIVNGSIAHPVKNAMFTGNVFDLLKNVSVIGNDVRQRGHLVSPTISFENQKIVG